MNTVIRWTEEQKAAMNDYASWLDAGTHAAIAQAAAPMDMSIRAETLQALYRTGVLPDMTPTLLADAVTVPKRGEAMTIAPIEWDKSFNGDKKSLA